MLKNIVFLAYLIGNKYFIYLVQMLKTIPISKDTFFFSNIKIFFKNFYIATARQDIKSNLVRVRMTACYALAVLGKHYCVYMLFVTATCLFLFLCFVSRSVYCNQEYDDLEPLLKVQKDAFYYFIENQDIDWRRVLCHISVQQWSRFRFCLISRSMYV